MAKINQNPPRGPMWPWGGPRSVRERLVEPAQFDRKKQLRKAGNPKSPALASAELLDFIGPAHSADELRLPLPPYPQGHDADLEAYQDRQSLASAAEKLDPEERRAIDRGLARLAVPPERLERMKALLGREGQMLALVEQLSDEITQIFRKMREEQNEEAY